MPPRWRHDDAGSNKTGKEVSQMLARGPFSRRRFLVSVAGASAVVLVAACSQSAPASPTAVPAASGGAPAAPTSAAAPARPAATTAAAPPVQSAGQANPAPTVAAAGAASLKPVPRNRTLILGITGTSLTDYQTI